MGKVSKVVKVYGSLAMFGIVSAFVSALTVFVTPLFDPNMAKVFFPMSLVFLLMIFFDYVLRGRNT